MAFLSTSIISLTWLVDAKRTGGVFSSGQRSWLLLRVVHTFCLFGMASVGGIFNRLGAGEDWLGLGLGFVCCKGASHSFCWAAISPTSKCPLSSLSCSVKNCRTSKTACGFFAASSAVILLCFSSVFH